MKFLGANKSTSETAGCLALDLGWGLRVRPFGDMVPGAKSPLKNMWEKTKIPYLETDF